MQFDWPIDKLRSYRPDVAGTVAPDFDAFWKRTLDSARAKSWPATLQRRDTRLKTVESFDLTFAGYDGQPIRAWLNRPAGVREALPCVVHFLGYGGGRGVPEEHLLWPSAGYAQIVMDTRGQGSGWTGGRGSPGETPDIAPGGEAGSSQFPGMLTRGIDRADTYYYRRLFTDGAMLLAEAARLDGIDARRIVASGASQGAATALAASSLVPVAAVLADVPFLSHVMEAIRITDALPYFELARYLKAHHGKEEAVSATLGYFDMIGFASRSDTPALYSVGLMDLVCPPRTVFAAANLHRAKHEISVYPYAGHEGGEFNQVLRQLAFLERLFDDTPPDARQAREPG